MTVTVTVILGKSILKSNKMAGNHFDSNGKRYTKTHWIPLNSLSFLKFLKFPKFRPIPWHLKEIRGREEFTQSAT